MSRHSATAQRLSDQPARGELQLLAPDRALPRAHALIDAAAAVSNAGVIRLTKAAALGDRGMDVRTNEGVLSFASLYPAMGSDIHSQLARSLGADTEDVGCIIVDAHQRTSVPDLYAAGDVVWDWIRSAMPWAKAASRPRPFATTWPRGDRSTGREG